MNGPDQLINESLAIVSADTGIHNIFPAFAQYIYTIPMNILNTLKIIMLCLQIKSYGGQTKT